MVVYFCLFGQLLTFKHGLSLLFCLVILVFWNRLQNTHNAVLHKWCKLISPNFMRCCDWNFDDIWKENYIPLNYRCWHIKQNSFFYKLLTGNSFSVLVKESTLVSQAKGSVIPTLMVKARFWLMLFIHKMVDFILTMMNTSPRLVHGGMDHRAYFMLLCTRLATP